ncbi:dual OB domain-containing protein [Burkholderia pseudomallei]|uniref:dual OB domain-containing protein n=1 Tax=Burkholderia pseudomallei TaxID=28450 RepID=UPI001AD6CE0B|nr:hypothetical protein [Burkholderia pseudomallei]MBO7806117.1 hypothetical protein [Burkholderia pseudomallei]
MTTKTILCLANSVKRGNHCVAGIELLPGGAIGGWIRPISTGPEDAVLWQEQTYSNGGSAQVLDIMNVPLIAAQPEGCQTENWLLDPHQRWTRTGQLTAQHLRPFVQDPPTVFPNGWHTGPGWNDEIPNGIADAHAGSLVLLDVPAVEIRVFASQYDNRLKVQARFEHRGERYWLLITDPMIRAQYLPAGAGRYQLGPCFLCVSVGKPFPKKSGEICRYKLVAAVIRQQ